MHVRSRNGSIVTNRHGVINVRKLIRWHKKPSVHLFHDICNPLGLEASILLQALYQLSVILCSASPEILEKLQVAGNVVLAPRSHNHIRLQA
jgi:hypothetical protein